MRITRSMIGTLLLLSVSFVILTGCAGNKPKQPIQINEAEYDSNAAFTLKAGTEIDGRILQEDCMCFNMPIVRELMAIRMGEVRIKEGLKNNE